MLSVQVPTVGLAVGVFVGIAVGRADGAYDGRAVGASVWPTVMQPCVVAHLRHSSTVDKKSEQQFFLPSAILEKSDERIEDSFGSTHTLHLLWSLLQVSAPEFEVGKLVGAAVGRTEPPAAAHPFCATQEAHCPFLAT